MDINNKFETDRLKESFYEKNHAIHMDAEKRLIDAIRKLPDSVVKKEIIQASIAYSQETTKRICRLEWEIMDIGAKVSFWRNGLEFMRRNKNGEHWSGTITRMIFTSLNKYRL